MIVYAVLNYEQLETIFSSESEAQDYIRFYLPTYGNIEKIFLDEYIDKNKYARQLESQGLYSFFIELPVDGSELPDKMGYGSSMFDMVDPGPEFTDTKINNAIIIDNDGFQTTIPVLAMRINAKDADQAMSIAKQRLKVFNES